MNLPLPRLLSLAIPLSASLLLSSCVPDGYHDVRRGPGGGGYMTYASLPPGYSGDSYYYNNRYYAGGRYETGRYTYAGRVYEQRYYHNGQYLYGGAYRQYPVARNYPAPRPTGGGGYVTYTTLPPNYAGSSYYYNNRYYAGGRYEPGRYTNQGRSYNGRYYHGGQYYYGGTPRGPAVQTRVQNPDQARNQRVQQRRAARRAN